MGDLTQAEATTTEKKDRITLGLYSKVNQDESFRAELEQYAESAFGESEIADEGDEDNPAFIYRLELSSDLGVSTAVRVGVSSNFLCADPPTTGREFFFKVRHMLAKTRF